VGGLKCHSHLASTCLLCHPFPLHGHLIERPRMCSIVSGHCLWAHCHLLIGPEGILLSLATPSSFQNAHKLSHPSTAHSATPNVPFPLSFPLASPNLSCQSPSSDPLQAHSQVMCSLCLTCLCAWTSLPARPHQHCQILAWNSSLCMWSYLFSAFGLMAFKSHTGATLAKVFQAMLWRNGLTDRILACNNDNAALTIGWHMHMAQVGEVQPGPIPVKPTPIWVWVQTCTVYLQVLSNTAGTHKPIQLCYYFHIIS